MQRYAIEDEAWFEAARTGLERRAFRLRLQPRSIIIEKDGRLPRIVGSGREFLEFADRQGLAVDEDAFAAAEAYGDGTRDSPFDAPEAGRAAVAGVARPGAAAQRGAAPVEARLAELRLEQERQAGERRAAAAAGEVLRQAEARCAALEAAVAEAVQQRDLYRLSAESAEARARVLQAALDGPEARGPDKKFNQLRRFLARELHPDLAGEDAAERRVREVIFKRVWSKIEQLQ